ncbi:hypothetical protein K456DRAFT_1915316 [Colletotrichum gloeosporioides 23]|nr:hypothetical protein K456DRAFT_1915316 [Colletotrichum gloeosporioides 23]
MLMCLVCLLFASCFALLAQCWPAAVPDSPGGRLLQPSGLFADGAHGPFTLTRDWGTNRWMGWWTVQLNGWKCLPRPPYGIHQVKATTKGSSVGNTPGFAASCDNGHRKWRLSLSLHVEEVPSSSAGACSASKFEGCGTNEKEISPAATMPPFCAGLACRLSFCFCLLPIPWFCLSESVVKKTPRSSSPPPYVRQQAAVAYFWYGYSLEGAYVIGSDPTCDSSRQTEPRAQNPQNRAEKPYIAPYLRGGPRKGGNCQS